MNDTSKPGETPTPSEQSMQTEGPASATSAAHQEGTPVEADAATEGIGVEQLRQMVEALQIDLEKTHADLKDKQDQLLRALAETENVRRRLEKEKSETAMYAIQKFAKDMLTVGDNFQRAIAAAPKGVAESDSALKSLIDGVVLAERDYQGALERHGVTAIDPAGQPFNPHHHQAVMEQDDATVPAGTVLQVYQVGYLIGDRCLRPAMVVVSRGGPKIAKTAEAASKPADAAKSEPADQAEAAASKADDAAESDANVPGGDPSGARNKPDET